MEFYDLLSPLRRRFRLFLTLSVVLSAVLFGAAQYLIQYEKVTIYFTVKAVGEAPAGNHYYSTEGAERMAEAISGWATDPNFRESVIQKASEIYAEPVVISQFKQKISARKQNRMNVFYTLQLPESERKYAGAITDAVILTLSDYTDALNANTPFPFTITQPERFGEWQSLPWIFTLMGAIILGFGAVISGVYIFEGMSGRVMHVAQVRNIFPTASLLFLQKGVSDHAPEILEPFLMRFSNPKLIGLFAEAAEFFSLAKMETLRLKTDQPVLLIRLGETTLTDVQNVRSIVGDKAAVIVYDA